MFRNMAGLQDEIEMILSKNFRITNGNTTSMLINLIRDLRTERLTRHLKPSTFNLLKLIRDLRTERLTLHLKPSTFNLLK